MIFIVIPGKHKYMFTFYLPTETNRNISRVVWCVKGSFYGDLDLDLNPPDASSVNLNLGINSQICSIDIDIARTFL